MVLTGDGDIAITTHGTAGTGDGIAHGTTAAGITGAGTIGVGMAAGIVLGTMAGDGITTTGTTDGTTVLEVGMATVAAITVASPDVVLA